MTDPINETKQTARESGLPDAACSAKLLNMAVRASKLTRKAQEAQLAFIDQLRIENPHIEGDLSELDGLTEAIDCGTFHVRKASKERLIEIIEGGY